jgi:DNA-directed RNA polymerase subunit F
MDAKKFEQLLEKIHEEVGNTDRVDEKGRELLQDLEQEIRSLLARTESQPENPALQRIRDAITHFEVTHPTLTATLSELSTILSNAGI